MSNPGGNGDQREFRCEHCKGKILIPANLPSTKGPCPHCQKTITSPGADLPPDLDPIFGRPIPSDPVPGASGSGPPPLPDLAELERKWDEQDERVAAEKAAAAKAREESLAKAEDERKQAEAKTKAEEERKAAEEAKAKAREEAVAKAENERALAEAKAKVEEERKAVEAEKARLLTEAKAAEEARIAAEAKAAEESKAAAEAKAEMERQAAKAKAEMERLSAESKAEMERQAAEAKAEMERLAAEAKASEAKQLAAAAAVAAAEVKAAGEKAEQERVAALKAAEERANQEKLAAVKAAEEAAAKQREAAKPQPVSAPLPSAPVSELPAASGDVRPTEAKSPQAADDDLKPGLPDAAPVEPVADKKLEGVEAPPKAKKEKKKRKVSVMPVAVMLVLIAVAGAAVLIVPKLLRNPTDPIVVDQTVAARQMEQEYLKSGWEADARSILNDFLEANTAAGKASHVIRGGELLGQMEAFYGEGGIDDSNTPESAFSVFPLNMKDKERGIFMLTYDQPPAFELSEFFTPLAPLQVKYQLREPDMLLASVGRMNNFTAEALQVHALFKRSEDGLKLDWETFVQTKYRTLRDFLDLPVPGRKGVFRVIVSETVPEKRNAPAGHRTYLIADPAHRSEDSARVYVAGDSAIGRAFSILNWRGTKEGRVVAKTATLELSWSNDATPQLGVSRFICWEFLGVGGEAIEP